MAEGANFNVFFQQDAKDYKGKGTIRGAASDRENVYVRLEDFGKKGLNLLKNYPTDDNYIELGLVSTLGHEIAHSNSYLKKLGYQDQDWYISQDGTKISQDEWYATVIENYIRIDQDLPLRTHYGYRYGNNSWVTFPDENSRVIQPANNFDAMQKLFNIAPYEIVKPR